MRTIKTDILYAAGFIIFMLCPVYVNAADNIVGGSSFGAKCELDANGKTCSCTPPETSSDCARLLKECNVKYIPVDEWYDDFGHPQTHQRVPDVTCTKTKCECKGIAKTTSNFPKPVIIQNPLVVPTKDAPTKTPLTKKFQKIPVGVGVKQKAIAPKNIVAPKNAKCVNQSKGKLSCVFGGKKYNCDGKRRNCVQAAAIPIRKIDKEEAKSGNNVIHFDEADALFGKRPSSVKQQEIVK